MASLCVINKFKKKYEILSVSSNTLKKTSVLSIATPSIYWNIF